MFDLSGKVALVTGAGQGVGAEIARVLHGAGATLVVNDLIEQRASSIADELATRAYPVTADVTDADSVGAMVAAASMEVGPVDILVNNAGVPSSEGWDLRPFHETPTNEWDRWIELNLHGVLNCTHAVLGGMIERCWGRVITIVSDAGRVGEPYVAVYAAAKAGAMGFSRSIAKEVARHGVTANCVALGTIEWPGGDATAYAEHARRYPAGRLGKPSDVAPAVLYLASDEAGWVTGQTLPVDGGYAPS